MKKIYLLLIALCLTSISVSAQDLIVTVDGDSLNCKITKLRDNYFYFTFKHQDEVRNTLLPFSQVTQYQFNYYALPDVQPGQIAGHKSEFPRWRFALNVGWGYRTDPVPDDFDSFQKEYMQKLKNGVNINFDACYFFTEIFGGGLKYDTFNATNSSGSISDDITINFFGPIFFMRFFDRTKTNSWFVNMGLGYLGYRDKMQTSGQSATMRSSTVGATYDIGYDIALSKNLSFGLLFSYLRGALYDYEITVNGVTEKKQFDKDQREGLNRVNFAVGVRYNF